MDVIENGYTCTNIGPGVGGAIINSMKSKYSKPIERSDYYYGMSVSQLQPRDKENLLKYWQENHEKHEGDLKESHIVPWKAAEAADKANRPWFFFQEPEPISFKSKQLEDDQYYYGMTANQLQEEDLYQINLTRVLHHEDEDLKGNIKVPDDQFIWMIDQTISLDENPQLPTKLPFNKKFYTRNL